MWFWKCDGLWLIIQYSHKLAYTCTYKLQISWISTVNPLWTEPNPDRIKSSVERVLLFRGVSGNGCILFQNSIFNLLFFMYLGILDLHNLEQWFQSKQLKRWRSGTSFRVVICFRDVGSRAFVFLILCIYLVFNVFISGFLDS